MKNPLWAVLESAVESNAQGPSLLTEVRTYSFAEVRSIATSVAALLRSHGVGKGTLVATLLPNNLDWFVVLGAAHEAALSVSLHHPGQAAELGIDVLVTTNDAPEVTGVDTVIRIDDAWIRRHESTDEMVPPRDFDSDDSLARLVLTSGTTGRAKAAEYSVATLQARLDNAANTWAAVEAGPVRLNLMGFASMGALFQGMMHLWSQTPYVCLSRITNKVPGLLVELDVSVVIGSTVSLQQLAHAVREQPETAAGIQAVLVAGSTPSDALLSLLGDTFGAPVMNMYGSTETGLVSSAVLTVGADLRNVGRPVPGVSIEVVGDNDEPLVQGETGVVRFSTPEVIERYYRDPEASATALRGGWFYPGDRGFLSADGSLVIVGRLDDVINYSGVKIDPMDYESIAASVDGVLDVALFVGVGGSGLEQLDMAIVCGDDAVLHLVDGALRAVFGQAVPARYIRLSELPRNQMGKLQRTGLADFVSGRLS